MNTLIKIVISLSLALLCCSCAFDVNLGQMRGNGNVITHDFDISEEFSSVSVSSGWEVFLEKGSEVSVTAEADENLIDGAEVYIQNNTLRIKAEKNINYASSKKIYVTYVNNLNGIKVSSGGRVTTKEKLKGENLDLDVSSGGHIRTEAIVRNIDIDVSSGGSIRLAGSTESLDADVSSGGMIQAEDLKAKFAVAEASSGGAMDIRVTDHLKARASSGGDIDYWGDPKEVDKPKKSYSGGSVSSKE